MNLFSDTAAGAALRPMRLVSADVARAVLNLPYRELAPRVESGELLWVFNVSRRTEHRRMDRFWAEELVDPRAVRQMRLAEVVEQVTRTQRPRLMCREVVDRLGVSEQHVEWLLRAGWVKCSREGKLDFVWLESLREFLQSSWLGNWKGGRE